MAGQNENRADLSMKLLKTLAREYQNVAEVTTEIINLSAILCLPKGTELTMTGASGGWARVKYRGVTGYVPSKYLNSEVRKGAYVNRSTYIYASASTSSSRKAVSVNTKVYVVGKSGSFYRVENSSGSATGYIPTGHLSSGRVSTASAP